MRAASLTVGRLDAALVVTVVGAVAPANAAPVPAPAHAARPFADAALLVIEDRWSGVPCGYEFRAWLVGAGSSFYGLAELTSLHPRWHGVKVSRRRLVRVRRELVTYLDAMAHARRRDRLEVTPMARKEYWTDDFPSGRLVAMGPGGHHVLSYRDLRRVLLWTDGPSQHALTVGFQTPFDDLDAMWSAYVRVLAELDIRSWRPFACDASFARS